MTVETVRTALGWCSIFDLGFLLLWFLMFTFFHDFVYRIHSRWFEIPVDRFDAIHYALLGGFKIAFFLLHLAPYLALHIVV